MDFGQFQELTEDILKQEHILYSNANVVNMSAEPYPAVKQTNSVGSKNAINEAMSARENLTTYFSSPAGAVAWQTSTEPDTLISFQP